MSMMAEQEREEHSVELARINLLAKSQADLQKWKLNEEHWFKSYWRPAMAWLYALICLFDFIVAPAVMMTLVSFGKLAVFTYTPLTLRGGGFIHVAFGAILGITSWTRGVEKRTMIDEMTNTTNTIVSSAQRPPPPPVDPETDAPGGRRSSRMD